MIDLRKRESKSNINEGEWPKGVSGIIGNIRDLASRYIRSHKNATTSEVVDYILDTIEKLPDGNMKNVSKDTIEKLVKDYNLDEKVFDPEKEYLRTINRYNAARAGRDVPGMTRGDQIDYLLSTWNYSTEEYDAVWAEFQKRCPNWLKKPRKENIEYIEKETDMIDLREKKTSKHEDDMEIKFVNKGDEFKSEKADDVKIVDIEKKDDKTEVTYKLGDEEKKNDIEDVIKMLNGAEYKKVDDKKDEKKACEDGDEEKPEEEPVEEKKSCEEDDAEETPDEEEPAEEKKTKKESVEDDSVEVTLTEDFHVPGTDIILEKGDVIRVIPKQEN